MTSKISKRSKRYRDRAVELSEQSRNSVGALHSKFEDVSQVGTQFVHTLLVVEMRVEVFLRNVVRCLREDDTQRTLGDRGVRRNDERLVTVGAAASQFDVLSSADDLEPKAHKNAYYVRAREDSKSSPHTLVGEPRNLSG